MVVTQEMLNGRTQLGGEISEIPQPFIFRHPNDFEKREIRVTITIWKVGTSIGAHGHYQPDIREEDNMLWNSRENIWQTPWNHEKDKGLYDAMEQIEGRSELDSGSTDPMIVCDWITMVLCNWNVTDKTHEIKWSFYGTEDDAENDIFKNNVKLAEADN